MIVKVHSHFKDQRPPLFWEPGLDPHPAGVFNDDMASAFWESSRLFGVGWGLLNDDAFYTAVVFKDLTQGGFSIQMVDIYLKPILSVNAGVKSRNAGRVVTIARHR